MTTSARAFSIDHQTDASFRAWVAEFKVGLDVLATAGKLTQTADTGQFANSAETRPATNTTTPYLIYYLNDSMHGTAPIYIKMKFGTSTASTRIRIDIEVGTGTNGSGTITGTAKTSVLRCDSAGGAFTGAASHTTYMCAVDGAFWVAHAARSVSTVNTANFFSITRTTDSAGAASATGANVFTFGNGATVVQNLRFASTAAALLEQGAHINAITYIGFVWTVETAGTLVSGVPQVNPIFGSSPAIYPLFSGGIIKDSEIAEFATFTWTPFGSTSHTYMSVDAAMGTPWPGPPAGVTTGNFGLAMIWE